MLSTLTEIAVAVELSQKCLSYKRKCCVNRYPIQVPEMTECCSQISDYDSCRKIIKRKMSVVKKNYHFADEKCAENELMTVIGQVTVSLELGMLGWCQVPIKRPIFSTEIGHKDCGTNGDGWRV